MMKKKPVDGRTSYLRGWRKHIYSLSRTSKSYSIDGVSRLTITDERMVITNPIVNFVEQFSQHRGLNRRFFNKDKIIVPKNLSFYDNPEESLQFIQSASKAISRSSNESLTIDYKGAQYKCLGAECLLGLAVIEARQSNINFEKRVVINGIYPKKESHREIIKAIGVVKEMVEATPNEIQDYSSNASNPKQRVFSVDSIGKENASAFAQDRKNQTSEKFTSYISDCLADHKLFLNELAHKFLTSCMGELLDNAERHCGLPQRPRWFVRGYVDNNSSFPVCELAIINFGNTIAETFERLSDEHYSYNIQVKPYVEKHIDKGGMFAEGLTTVAALQGRVSCKNETEYDSSGTGTIELLKFFQDMHDDLRELRGSKIEKPKMSLISGSTHLCFDGKYPLLCALDDDEESELFSYPFNHKGLAYEPDRTYLKEMKNAFFPGVMVNIRFPLAETKRT